MGGFFWPAAELSTASQHWGVHGSGRDGAEGAEHSDLTIDPLDVALYDCLSSGLDSSCV